MSCILIKFAYFQVKRYFETEILCFLQVVMFLYKIINLDMNIIIVQMALSHLSLINLVFSSFFLLNIRNHRKN